MSEEFEKYWVKRKSELQSECDTDIQCELECGRYTAQSAFKAGQGSLREENSILRDRIHAVCLNWQMYREALEKTIFEDGQMNNLTSYTRDLIYKALQEGKWNIGNNLNRWKYRLNVTASASHSQLERKF